MAKLRIIHYKINRKKSLLYTDRPFRIAMLADLHDNPIARDGGILRRHISRMEPDLIVCCGDMLTAKFGESHTRNALSLLEELSQRYPVYYVNGNHETRLAQMPERFPEADRGYFRSLSRMGVRLLNNATALIPIAGTKIALAGYEAALPQYGRIRRMLPDEQNFRENLGDPSEEYYTILLSHHPDFFDAAARWGADLVLSGHLHGGMVRLPFAGGVVGASLVPFPRYDRGKYLLPGKDGDCTMIVSAGLGDHTIPGRWNDPYELVILECGQ